MKPQVLEAVAALQSKWQNLPDVDRAEAIVRILAAGMVGRGLANALNCSEALIRYLKPLVEALPEEKRLARLGKISTRELKRRIAERKAEKANKKEQAAEFACLEAAHRGADHILQWSQQGREDRVPLRRTDRPGSAPQAEGSRTRRQVAERESSGRHAGTGNYPPLRSCTLHHPPAMLLHRPPFLLLLLQILRHNRRTPQLPQQRVVVLVVDKRIRN